MGPEEAPQHSWANEMRCEVYSRSLKSWLPGTVIEVDDDEINVSYVSAHAVPPQYDYQGCL